MNTVKSLAKLAAVGKVEELYHHQLKSSRLVDKRIKRFLCEILMIPFVVVSDFC